MKIHLKPLQKTIALFENKTRNLIKRRFRLWNALIKPQYHEEIKEFANKIQKKNSLKKYTKSNFVSSNKESNEETSQDDLELSQNTTMNNIIRLMKANRIKNLHNHYSLKTSDNTKYKHSYQSLILNNTTTNNKISYDDQSIKKPSFLITKIMEKCPEMSLNKEIFASFDTYNKPENEQDTINSSKIGLNKSKRYKSNSNLIDEFYVDYLNKESRLLNECINKGFYEKPPFSKPQKRNEYRLNKTKSLDSYTKNHKPYLNFDVKQT